jgi:hypothetical protein
VPITEESELWKTYGTMLGIICVQVLFLSLIGSLLFVKSRRFERESGLASQFDEPVVE